MVGFFPEMVPVQVDRLPCKRKPGEMLKEGKRNEEKKLRVEKVVTALCNTDTKNTPMSKNGERREKHVGRTEAKCTCGNTTTSASISKTSPITHAYDPLTHVTYSVNSKVCKEEKEKGFPVAHPAELPPPIYHYILPQQIAYPRPFVKLEPQVVKVEPQSNPPNTQPFVSQKPVVPILPSTNKLGTPRDFKNVDIIRVPRDNKTPFVVFKPELYASNFIAVHPPYLQRAAPMAQHTRVPIILENNMVAMQPPPLTMGSTSSLSSSVPLTFHNVSFQQPKITSVYSTRTTTPEVKTALPDSSVPTAMLRIPNIPTPSSTQPVVSRHSIQHLIKNNNCAESAKQKSTLVGVPSKHNPLSKYPGALTSWTADDVYKYLKGTDCAEYADVFKTQEIDGKTLPLLDEITISRLLDIKMGPAIKLTALIKSLINML